MIELLWPPKELNPNKSSHWRKKSEKTKSYRHDCYITALGTSPRREFSVTFHPPIQPGPKPDVQNIIAAMKAGIDGLQDAWGIDDSEFAIDWPTQFAEPVKHGKVVVQ